MILADKFKFTCDADRHEIEYTATLQDNGEYLLTWEFEGEAKTYTYTGEFLSDRLNTGDWLVITEASVDSGKEELDHYLDIILEFTEQGGTVTLSKTNFLARYITSEISFDFRDTELSELATKLEEATKFLKGLNG